MIVATLVCYFCFFYFYLYKNNPKALRHCGFPAFLCAPNHHAVAWGVLIMSLIPWWYLLGFEVGVAAWLLALSLVALPIVLAYPVIPALLLRVSKRLLIVGLLLIVLGELGVAYVR